MKVLRVFHQLGCVGYSVLAILISVALIPVAILILRTGDESTIALASTAMLIAAMLVAALVVLLRRTDLLMACAVWVPIYFVTYLALILSLNGAGNGYRLTDNPRFGEWETFLLCLITYQVPVLAVHAVRNWRAGSGWFEPDVARMKARGDVTALIRALGSRNANVRIHAAGAFFESVDDRAVEPLIAALEDPLPDVRRNAVVALGKSGDHRAAGPLLAALEDPDGLVASGAAEALGALGSEQAVEPLIVCLQSRNPFLRLGAIRGLGSLGDPRAVEPLVATMRAGSDSERRLAVQALAILGEPGGQRAIAEFLRLNPSQRVDTVDSLAWSTALSGARLSPELKAWLAVVRSGWDVAVSLGEAAVKPLSARMWDPDRTVAVAAVEALARIGGADAAYHLAHRLNSGDDVGVRQAAARALGQIGGSQAVEPLLQAVEKVLEEGGGTKPSLFGVRCAAAEELGQLGDRRAVTALITALVRQKDELRAAAAKALCRITGQDLGDDAAAWQGWWNHQENTPDESGTLDSSAC